MDIIDQVLEGDVLEKLKEIPDDYVDVSVTSPPYNKQENKKGWLVKNVKYSHSIDALPEDEYQHTQVSVLNEIFRITKPGGAFFYNHKVRWEKGEMIHPYSWITKSEWTIRQEIIWDRMIAANIRGWRFWQIDERIYWLQKPLNGNKIGEELKSRHALLTSIWRFPPERANAHPAPYPLVLPIRAIYSILDDKVGGIVLDPYCGSGTTLVAAKILGHHYIGIDISPQYVEQSCLRLSNYKSELEDAQKEIQLHAVNDTFDQRKKKSKNTGKFGPKQIKQDELF